MAIQQFTLESVHPLFTDIPGLDKARDTLHIKGCAGSFDAFLIGHLFQRYNNSLLIVVPDAKRADVLTRECSSLIGSDCVASYPSRDAIPYNMHSPFGPTIEKRFRVLSHLIHGDRLLYIATSAALLQKIPSQKELFNHIISLHINDEIPPDTLASWLADNGFSRETLVQDIGTFAIRGGIVDIYPFLTDNPIRLEFFGDTIESIREFDVFTQKSLSTRSNVDIYPMKEFCFSERHIDQALALIQGYCKQHAIEPYHAEKLKHIWKSQPDHDGIEWFLHWFDLSYATLLDFLPSDCIFVWDDLFNLDRRLKEVVENYDRHLNRVPDMFLPFVSKPKELLFPYDQIGKDSTKFKQVYIDTDIVAEEILTHTLPLIEQQPCNKNIRLLLSDLRAKDDSGYLTTILCESKGHAERLQEILEEGDAFVHLSVGYMERGFVDTVHKIACYSEQYIFNRTQQIVRTKKIKKTAPIIRFDALLPGDHVVHIEHGIARFLGTERITTEGIQRDCMVLEYQNRARVFVPIDDFYKVQKYIGKDSSLPILSKLGTARWEKQKAKARESLREMAEYLISLYAKRSCLEGISFSKDSIWQKEFEESFIYDPTPDQLTAVADVKKDMESSKPMDRLVCGDVGFGKTEIAMRAAAKAALDGYQVALLAPTTILAAQHVTTFTERMTGLPVTVAALSRFLKTKQQREILKKIKHGSIDIIIGTHRILSKDVVFNNLGLLIIDEEQRFGVRHKEKLKEYRYTVDVLSMTATPIPRTLHMSLIGIRDLSIINSPPRNRLPIETHVTEYHDEIIKEAIENELERGGQVYVVHNRIQTLPQFYDRIETAVPQARIAVAHGQMDERPLELVMKEFVAGKYDVLLSTAIIENGLDIPNVNTIIVTNADTLGLSQLYQLRGRVGRSAEQAYAYFLTVPHKEIKEVSLKRLRALEQYTDLGSGFQIAMRDLEIRGAGNLLGTDQHGTIAAVGFDLYCTLLKEEIDRVMGHTPESKAPEITIDFAVDAYIPADYIADSTTRIALYHDCSACATPEDIHEMERDFIDRFGPLPDPVRALFLLLHVKAIGQKAGLSHIRVSPDNNLSLSFHGTDELCAERIKTILAATSRHCEVVYGTPVVLKTQLTAKTSQTQLNEIIHFLCPNT